MSSTAHNLGGTSVLSAPRTSRASSPTARLFVQFLDVALQAQKVGRDPLTAEASWSSIRASRRCSSGNDARPTSAFQRVVQRAVTHIQWSGRKEVTGANVLLATFAQTESPAVRLLGEHDMTRQEAVNFGAGKAS
jgi:ATP-dependent Clp protease ATP-binding subunit ClpA